MSERWVGRLALLTGIGAALWGSGVIPAIIPQAVPTANKQGNGIKFQLAAGSTPTAGNCLTVDASANIADSGISTCGGAGTVVNSVFGRTGGVTAQANDYNFNQLAGTLATSQVGSKQGNGSLVQLSSGSTVDNNCVKFSSGNAVDAGFPCGNGSTQNSISQGTYASLPASATTAGDTYFTTDSNYSFVWNGSSWTARYSGYPATLPPLVSGLTYTNQGTSTANNTFGFIAFSAPGTAGSLNVLEKAKPAGAWTFTVGLEINMNATQDMEVGILIRDSSGGRGVLYGTARSSGTNAALLDTWTTVTNHNGGAPTGATALLIPARFVQLVNDGAGTCTFNISTDGVQFIQITSGACNAWVPSGGDRVGIAIGSSSATASIPRQATFFSWSGV